MASTRLKIRALDDIWAFCELIKFRGGPSTFGEMHEDMARFNTRAQKDNQRLHRRRINFVARGHRKSTINTTLMSLWRIYRNPNIRVGVGTNVKKLATSFVRELRFYLENEELQEEVWNSRPHIDGRLIPVMNRSVHSRRQRIAEDDTSAEDRKIVWNNWQLQVLRTEHRGKEPTVSAFSLGMPITGDHYDFIILDDLVDFRNSKTLEGAMKVLDFARDLEAVLHRKSEWYDITPTFGEFLGDELLINGTKYYLWDLYSNYIDPDLDPKKTEQLLQAKRYSAFIRTVYKNGRDSSDGYTLPDDFNDEVMGDLENDIGTRKLYSQYLLRVKNPQDQVIDTESIKYLTDDRIIERRNGMATVVFSDNDKKRIRLYLVIDPALAKTRKSDSPAIAVGGITDDNRIVVVDLVCKKLNPSLLVDEVYRLCFKWNLQSVTTEIGGQQEFFVWLLKQEYNYTEELLKNRTFKQRKPITIFTVYHGEEKIERIEHHLEMPIKDERFYLMAWMKRNTPIIQQLDYIRDASVKKDAADAVAILVEMAKPTAKSLSQPGSAQEVVPIAVNSKYGGIR